MKIQHVLHVSSMIRVNIKRTVTVLLAPPMICMYVHTRYAFRTDAAGIVRGLEDWVMASVTRVALRDDNDTVVVNKKTDNIQLTMKKMKLSRFKRAELASFPENQKDKDGSVQCK